MHLPPPPGFPLNRLAAHVLAATLAAALPVSAHAGQTPPANAEFSDLGTLYPNDTVQWTAAYAVSANGAAVVGESCDQNDNCVAFHWNGGVMTNLGTLPGGSWSHTHAVSADGSVVVGRSGRPDNTPRAFRWTGGVMTDLGALPGGNGWSGAEAVSADGNVAAGWSYDANATQHAVRWTQAGAGIDDLGVLPGGSSSYALAVSADGSVVVGDSVSTGGARAFRWTQAGGMTDLGVLVDGGWSRAEAVSADGSVVAGESTSANGNRVFRWTQAGGMVDLGILNGGKWTQFGALSTDGSTVVGSSDELAFRWTQAGGMTSLGTLPGDLWSYARAVSADGSVVVGMSSAPAANGDKAFRWVADANGGTMQSVADWLGANGVPTGNWLLTEAVGVSANGNVVVGNGSDGNNATTHPWLARVGPAGGLLVDVAAFNTGLVEANSGGLQASAALPNQAMFGAHHRSLLDSGLARTGADGACAWATTDASGHNPSDSQMNLIEVGACKDIGSTRIGLGVGQAWSRQDLTLAGNARHDGQYLIAEAAHAFANGMEGSVTGYLGRFDSRISRNYLNGAAVDTSVGNTHADAVALRARVDWKDLTQLGTFNLSPYAALTWSETKLDAYTETGGAGAASFGAAVSRSTDLRLGAAARKPLSGNADLRLALEAVQRVDDTGSGITSSGGPTGAVALAGVSVNKTWARAMVDVDYRLNPASALTFGANAATDGGDGSWGVTLGYRANF